MTFIKMGGVNAIVKNDKPRTAAELASDTGAEKLLISMEPYSRQPYITYLPDHAVTCTAPRVLIVFTCTISHCLLESLRFPYLLNYFC